LVFSSLKLSVSSIAVKYQDKSSYYYAQSKELAELAVKQSGLAYTIVRPTIVIGADSPVWESLSKLAKMPLLPVFGNGKSVIQPIYIDDLVSCLLTILDGGIFTNETIELGGPEQVTFENFLRAISRSYRGREPRTFHLPLAPFLFCLSMLEKHFYTILPLTVGQLSAFKNDSTIDGNHIFDQHRPRMKSIDEMVKMALEDRKHRG